MTGRESEKIFRRVSFLIVSAFLIGTCQKNSDILSPYADAFYFNSFESESDLQGWEPQHNRKLYDEAPPGGGFKSLCASSSSPFGVWYLFTDMEEDGYYTLEFWGKLDGSPGSVWFYSGEDNINIDITDREWRHFKTNGAIFCSRGGVLGISINNHANYYYGSILVDRIWIKKVDD